MTAKGELLSLMPNWTDEQAAIALRAVERTVIDEAETAPAARRLGRDADG